MTELPTTVFGPGAWQVTRIGLGGEGVLRTRDREAEAREVIHEAIQQKITNFDPHRIEEAFRPYAAKLAFYRGALRT